MTRSSNSRVVCRLASLGILVALFFGGSCGSPDAPQAVDNSNTAGASPQQPGPANSAPGQANLTKTPIGTAASIPSSQNYMNTGVVIYGAPALTEDVKFTVKLLDMANAEAWGEEVTLKAGSGALRVFRVGDVATKKLRNGGKLAISTDNGAITEYTENDRIELGNGRFTTTLNVDVPNGLFSAKDIQPFGSGTFTTPVGVTIVLVPLAISE